MDLICTLLKEKKMISNKYEAVIFDMDGVLIDSEPLWKIALENVFQSLGSNLTKKDFQKTVGLRIDEVISFWLHHEKWENVSIDDIWQMILKQMIHLLQEHGKPMYGVLETLAYLKAKGIKIGLATSSYTVLMEKVLEVLNISNYFDFVHSAEHEPYGKPHPAVYLSVAKALNVHPLNCIVVEDSINGVIAGKAARMHVVCIPEKTHEPNNKLIVADEIFDNMHEWLSHIQ